LSGQISKKGEKDHICPEEDPVIGMELAHIRA